MKSEPITAKHRDVLLVILTLTTGALDAVTFLRLGKVFSSVITGNLALLGLAAGQHDATLAANGGLALAGYAVGVAFASILAGTPERGQPVWPRRVTGTLAAELGVLIVFSAVWLISGSDRGPAARLSLLILASAAMGMQSATVRRLGQMSTTYLTSTLTAIVSALVTGGPLPGWQRSVGVIVTLVIGALLGALAATQSPAWAPAVVLTPLASVLVCLLALSARPARPAAG